MQNEEQVDAGIGLNNKQPHEAVRVILRSDGKRRIVIFRRSDSLYGYREDALYDHEVGKYWASFGAPATICDTAEHAEREARASIGWLIAKST